VGRGGQAYTFKTFIDFFDFLIIIIMQRGAMRKRPRLKGKRLYHHIYAWGNDRHPVFKTDAHYEKYLYYLERFARRYRVDIIAYALMEWHVHLFIFDILGKISQFMNSLHGEYAQFFNKETRRVGHVFGERFNNKIVQANNYGLWLSRYIHRQAVEARMVKDPKDYPWTSYRAYLGLVPKGFLQPDIILKQFGSGSEVLGRYQEFVLGEDSGPIDWAKTTVSIIGDEGFRERVESRDGDKNEQETKLMSDEDLIKEVSSHLAVKPKILTNPYGWDERRLRHQAIQSLYCLERDGYWVFGDKPYQTTDWGYENLRYKFTNLDPTKIYRMDLSYYFENNPRIGADDDAEERGHDCSVRLQSDDGIRPSEARLGDEARDGRYENEGAEGSENINEPDRPDEPKGIGRIIQALIVDGVSLDTSFITPNKLKRISINLPHITYTDGEIIGDILSVKGKRVVCAEIALYEFGGEEKISRARLIGGPQGEDALRITLDAGRFEVYPNPFHDKTTIKFEIRNPKSETNSNSQNSNLSTRYLLLATLRIYDATGRLVKSFNLASCLWPLASVVSWSGDDDLGRKLPAGVYFVRLEAGEFKKVEKAILLR